MDIKVKSLFLKSSPQKVRPVLHGLRGKTLESVMTELKFTNKKGARFMFELVKAGLAAAKENDLDTEKVIIKSINCTEGPRLKRRLIGSRGRAKPILKRMCHLNLVVTDINDIVKETEIKATAIGGVPTVDGGKVKKIKNIKGISNTDK